ncbi:MAG: hypothetical protein JRN73_07880 [Nitrososphaerota archaeon]|nr:hypothetical protein [Nitrososphaerota archaeon]
MSHKRSESRSLGKLARGPQEAAAAWGNLRAKGWRSDPNYASFLGSLLVRERRG